MSYLSQRAVTTIAIFFQADPDELNFVPLHKGMTNHSFRLDYGGKSYHFRQPRPGRQIIDRTREAAVYQAIAPYNFCDSPLYLDPETGYKLSPFLPQARPCNPKKEGDLVRWVEKIKRLHQAKIELPHSFDLFAQIKYYEQIRGLRPSLFPDYREIKEQIFSLKPYLDTVPKESCLTHLDPVADNCLFYQEGGQSKLQLTDWEYAGMQDPHVDLAMFAIYAGYERAELDHLLDLYFGQKCPENIKSKIYCYTAICGLLWSNWCEAFQPEQALAPYGRRQYRYAKEYAAIALKRTGVAG